MSHSAGLAVCAMNSSAASRLPKAMRCRGLSMLRMMRMVSVWRWPPTGLRSLVGRDPASAFAPAVQDLGESPGQMTPGLIPDPGMEYLAAEIDELTRDQLKLYYGH